MNIPNGADHTTGVESSPLHQKRDEPSMADEDDVLIGVREVSKSSPNPLSAGRSVPCAVRRIVPLGGTVREVELGKPGDHVGAGAALVADGVVRLAQVRPDPQLDGGAGAGEELAECDERGLDGARHGGDEDEVWVNGREHRGGLLDSERCQRRVSVGVLPIDAAWVRNRPSKSSGYHVAYLWSDCPWRRIWMDDAMMWRWAVSWAGGTEVGWKWEGTLHDAVKLGISE